MKIYLTTIVPAAAASLAILTATAIARLLGAPAQYLVGCVAVGEGVLVVYLLWIAMYLSRTAARQAAEVEAALANTEEEIAVRADAERQLMLLTESLEERVAERTAAAEERAQQLAEVNQRLEAEIGERTKAEIALRELGQRYRDLYDNAPDMYVAVDADTGAIIECNHTVAAVTGYAKEELLGLPVLSLYDPRWVDDAKAAETLLRDAGKIEDAELRLRRKDGTTVDVSLSMTAEYDSQRRLVQIRESWRDITDRKAALEALARQAQDLRRTNSELEQFAYVTAHDLQEPVRMVTSFTQLLARRQKGCLDDEAQQFVDFAVEGATRIHYLLNDLLTFLEIGKAAPGRADAGAALDRALAHLRPEISEHEVLVDVAGAMPSVFADQQQLAQVFEQLIGNAVKFRTEKPPRIIITTQAQGDEWLFRVSDNGIGIAPEYRERIFKLFQRLHERGAYAGTGTGLAICRKIVEHYGGRIWVESKDAGAAFCFVLPGADTQAAA
ncbi:MAG: ATP-binding protein [Dehalococcoidia bacterium]